jgi:amino-acid N-acetyltransferase
MKYRNATAEDLPAVESLLVTSGLPTAGVSKCIGDFILAESSGRIVGTIGLEVHGQYGLLRSAAVADHARGNGVGRYLVERLLARAAEDHLDSVYLLTTTAEDYFPRFGFTRTSRAAVPADLMSSEEFRGACPDSATVMVYRPAIFDE